MFAFHNHLFKNPYDLSCWFIDKKGGVWCFNDVLKFVYTSKAILSVKSENRLYNSSIVFASKDIFIINNGSGILEFLLKKDDCIKEFLINDIEPSVILDARFVKETSKIIIALYKIDEKKDKNFSRLILLTYHFEENSKDRSIILDLVRTQTIKVNGAIDSVYFEKNGKFFNIISQKRAEFDFDSTNPIKSKEEIKESKINIPKYCWSQDKNSITVFINIPEQYKTISAKVDVKQFNLTITIDDVILLCGETSNKIDSYLTTWKQKENNLEVELCKAESGLMWSELLKGDTGGEYLPNEELAAEIHSRYLFFFFLQHYLF